MNPDLQTYMGIVENSADAILVMVDLLIVFANQKAVELYGASSKDELIGQNALDLGLLTISQHQRTEELENRRVSGALMDGSFEFPATMPDGRELVFDVRISNIDFNGKTGALCIIRDITSVKESEKNLKALHDSTAKLSRASNRDEITWSIMETLNEILGMDYVAVGFVENNDLVFTHSTGDVTITKLPLDGKGVTVRAVREMKTQVIGDVTLDPDFINGRSEGSVESLSELVVPILVDGEAIGVINVEENIKNAFTVEEVQLVEILANHFSSALTRIKNDTVIRDMREAHLLEMVGGVDKMCVKVQNELKGPIQSIRNSSFLIRHNPDLSDEVVDAIDNSLELMVTTLEEMKEITNPTDPEKTLTDVYSILNQAIDVSGIPGNIELVKEYDDGFMALSLDKEKIKRAFFNIIRNSVEAMPKGGEIRISMEIEDGNLVLKFKDNGPGIPKKTMDKIFQPFFSTKPSSLGLGLSFCKLAVESSGGKLGIDSVVNQGTTITISLPM